MSNELNEKTMMSIAHAAREADVNGFGLLVRHDRNKATSSVKRPDGTTVRWENASFVAVPTQELLTEVEAELRRRVVHRENARTPGDQGETV